MMNIFTIRIDIRIVILASLIFTSSFNLLLAQENIRSKIAIMLVDGRGANSLRSNDRVSAGDSIWILVQPLTKLFVYVIYSDEDVAVLLKPTDSLGVRKEHTLYKGDTLILPSIREAYVLDALNPIIKFSIICGKSSIVEIENLFKNNTSVKIDLWHSAEQKVLERFSSNLTSKKDKPFSIAGNVRGDIEIFLTQQPVFEGKEIIIRTYNIEVKK